MGKRLWEKKGEEGYLEEFETSEGKDMKKKLKV